MGLCYFTKKHKIKVIIIVISMIFMLTIMYKTRYING